MAMNDKFNKENLLKGLTETSVALNQTGVIFTESGTNLCAKIEQLFADRLQINEFAYAALKPTLRGNIIEDMKMYFFFDSTRPGKDFNRGGKSNGNMDTIDEYLSATSETGAFVLSEHFKTCIGPLVMKEDPNQKYIKIEAVPSNKAAGAIEVDVLKVMELLLGIKEDDPYSFNLLFGQIVQNQGGTDSIIVFSKTIFTTKQNNRPSSFDFSRAAERFLGNSNGGNGGNNNNRNNYNRNDRSQRYGR